MLEDTNLFLEVGTDCNAVGSATWEFGPDNVICTLYGPDDVKSHEEFTHRAFVDVSVMAGGNSKEILVENYFTSIVERIVDVKEFPLKKLSVKFYIVCGLPDSPCTVSAMTNALSLALLQSELPVNVSLSSICFDHEDLPIAVTVDTSHPNFRGGETKLSSSAIFSVFMGPHAKGISPFKLKHVLKQISMGDENDVTITHLRDRIVVISNIMVEKLTS